MVRWLVGFALALLLQGCATNPDTAPAASGRPSATATPSLTPQPTRAPLERDQIVTTQVEDLPVWEMPGGSQTALGTLERGAVGLVVGDAIAIDGAPWYPVTGLGLPPGTGCLAPPDPVPFGYCGAWRGWVAGAGADGEASLAPASLPVDCPAPSLEGILGIGYVYRLVCYGNRDLTMTAFWPDLPPDAGLGGACEAPDAIAWLRCQNINYVVVTSAPDEPFLSGLRLSIDPESDLSMPPRGQWVEVIGHFDDPAAQRCGGEVAEGADPAMVVLDCRLEFVARSVQGTAP